MSAANYDERNRHHRLTYRDRRDRLARSIRRVRRERDRRDKIGDVVSLFERLRQQARDSHARAKQAERELDEARQRLAQIAVSHPNLVPEMTVVKETHE